jgi:hypothetical protein
METTGMENEQTIENPKCGCGGPTRANPLANFSRHRVGDPGCLREMVEGAPRRLEDRRDVGAEWELEDGSVVTEYTLLYQRGYFMHAGGRWSRQLGGSDNSIREEHSEWPETPGVALPCPFCGKPPKQGEFDPGAPYPGAIYYVACEEDTCPASNCVMDSHGVAVSQKDLAVNKSATMAKLIKRWNTRRPEPPENVIAIVEDLNMECHDHLDDDFTSFEVRSNGYEIAVTFCGYPIWGTEDNGDRVYDEDKDTYEPLEGYLRRAALRLLRDLNNLYNQWEKRE